MEALMNSHPRLKLLRNLGRVIVLTGLSVAFYHWFVQPALLISPVAFTLMVVGVLTMAIAELINWVKTGSLKL
jgi:hypothetical protein